MTIQEQGIITLLKSAVTGEKLPIPEGFSLENAYPVLKAHTLLPLGYEGARLCGFPKNLPVMQKLFQKYCTLALVSERQMQAVQELFDTFDREKISYMPIKGCNLKALYPDQALRYMGDADVLIRMDEYDRVRPLMQKLGYEEKEAYFHELPWNGKALQVELHKMLIPPYHPELNAYYGDGWKTAKLCEGTRYAMTPEDQYIYIFTHFTKHFEGGGVGLRQALDLWVYRRHYENLNMDYVHGELRKLHLLEFHENMEKVLQAWFCGGPWDDRSAFISEYIFHNGVWGTREQKVRWSEEKKSIAAGEQKISRGKWLRRALFPSAEVLSERYPVVGRCPVLLPGVWVWRWVDAALFRRKNITNYRKGMKAISRENVDSFRRNLEFVGLQKKEKS